ncbi:unnamed protein product [Miscanthus lutarioriparius]|uniref:Uncharacterized protein n=1 Tax=Miscanthus lutarioriparius TaxID=422564 RepID=A0A811SJ53_9POAL|nr:unnamed protein product [Miscanthus lutarioriparius]
MSWRPESNTSWRTKSIPSGYGRPRRMCLACEVRQAATPPRRRREQGHGRRPLAAGRPRRMGAAGEGACPWPTSTDRRLTGDRSRRAHVPVAAACWVPSPGSGRSMPEYSSSASPAIGVTFARFPRHGVSYAQQEDQEPPPDFRLQQTQSPNGTGWPATVRSSTTSTKYRPRPGYKKATKHRLSLGTDVEASKHNPKHRVSFCSSGIEECKEKLYCQCKGCSCKNTWESYECSCGDDNMLYMREHDTCISTFLVMRST